MTEQIEGGATLWARQTIESEIFYDKPDKWFKIWFYLVNRVSHKDTKRYKRGETFLQYEWLCDATGASQNQVKKCLMWLRDSSMIRTRRSTRGTNIEILNYSHFQTIDNYYYKIKEPHKELEKNQRRTREEPRYYKNVRMKECNNTEPVAKAPLIDSSFNQFWELYDYKLGRMKAEKAWSKLTEKQKKLTLEYLPDYIKSTPDKKFRKHPTTFLNGQCWEDEIITKQTKRIFA